MAAMLKHTTVNEATCLRAATDPALLATDLVDHLVRKGRSFRRAHHEVGKLVALAEQSGKRLGELSVAEMQSVDAKLDAESLKVFDVRRALDRRNLVGAPGTKEVKKQLARWKTRLSE
jgi:argininosuccinate lyase